MFDLYLIVVDFCLFLLDFDWCCSILFTLILPNLGCFVYWFVCFLCLLYFWLIFICFFKKKKLWLFVFIAFCVLYCWLIVIDLCLMFNDIIDFINVFYCCLIFIDLYLIVYWFLFDFFNSYLFLLIDFCVIYCCSMFVYS